MSVNSLSLIYRSVLKVIEYIADVTKFKAIYIHGHYMEKRSSLMLHNLQLEKEKLNWDHTSIGLLNYSYKMHEKNDIFYVAVDPAACSLEEKSKVIQL